MRRRGLRQAVDFERNGLAQGHGGDLGSVGERRLQCSAENRARRRQRDKRFATARRQEIRHLSHHERGEFVFANSVRAVAVGANRRENVVVRGHLPRHGACEKISKPVPPASRAD